MSVIYDERFFKGLKGESMRSAVVVIPHLLEITQPDSIIDIGCGVGSWLCVFKNKHGVKEVLGVDGDYVDINMLQIDKSEFIPYDLEKYFKAPKKFDLAMSLEVGEHLPENCADNLVQSLTDASDFIMFSAAMPGQTGTNHINEQFPEYWAKKFIKSGYVCVDCIRKDIWNEPDVAVWYKQNILIYVKADVYENKYKGKLDVYKQKTDVDFLTRAHPESLMYFKDKFYQTRSLIGFLRYHLAPLKKLWTKPKQ